jgi:hypothetical protein
MESPGKLLVALGLALAALGLWLQFGPALPWLGRLPGDIRVERPGFRFYFPLATCVLASALLTAIAWLWGRLR